MLNSYNIFTEAPLKEHMATHELHQQIDSRLKQLLDLHREMQQHSSSVPYAEIDLFLQKVRQLYEASLLLHHHNALKTMEELEAAIAERYAKSEPRMYVPSPEAIKAVVSENPIQSAPVAETPISTVESSVPEIPMIAEQKNEPVQTEKEIPSVEKIQAPSPESVRHTFEELLAQTSVRTENTAQPNTVAKPKKGSGDLHEMFDEVPTLAGKFEEIETFGERIATHQSPTRIGEKLQRKPVKDLKVAIGINEKFQFINQLFNGDSSTYHSAVEHLNNCQSFEAASGYVNNNLVSKYNWDLATAPATVFIDLVERRFIA